LAPKCASRKTQSGRCGRVIDICFETVSLRWLAI
jgi:hypothetical protein